MTETSKRPSFRRRNHPDGLVAEDLHPDVSSHNDAVYRVGYCKPPVEHRFKPGKSGNPQGRPKGARGVDTLYREILERKVEMRIGGRTRKVSHIEALITKQLELAAKGDQRALAMLIQGYRRAVPDSEVAPETGAEIDSAADQAILEAYRAMIAEELAASGGAS